MHLKFRWYIFIGAVMATFQKRGERWRAIVRRKGFPAQSRSFPTKSAARAWAERIERELAEQAANGGIDDRISIAELIDWHEQTVGAIRPLTETQKGNLSRIREGLGEHIARKLSTSDVIEHARRRVQGLHMLPSGKLIPAVSPATMAIELGYLSELLKLAASMRKGFTLTQDPVANARPALRLLGAIGKSKWRNRRPTHEELERIRAHYEQQAWRTTLPMNDIIDFALLTARREGEITRLMRSDLDSKDKSCLLRDVKHPRKKKGNNKRFPLLNGAWEIAQRQPVIKEDERIFPFDSRSIGASFTRTCAKLGIEDLHFHDLRHEATSRLFEQGLNIPQVASVTLHASWNDLKRYTHFMPDNLQKLIQEKNTD